jgi:hypothetical protein
MTRESWTIFSFGVYFLLFICAVGGLAIWKIKRRRSRLPVEFKLLRGPGETLRRRMAKFDENFVFRIGGAALAPVFVALVVFGGVLKYRPQTWTQLWVGFGLTVLAFVATLIPAMHWALRGLMRYRDDRLGYLGERYVGECLEPLKEHGWHVFHDVPCEADRKKFNIDHVVVGPGGVWAIETKTRRKGRARRGFEPHKVVFDGKQLIWPWGEDPYGPDQAIDNADWLQQWLSKKTGMKTKVWPVLTFPGWYVVDKAGAAVRVVRPEWLSEDLPKVVTLLTNDQIDLIVRQLDERCRDVED